MSIAILFSPSSGKNQLFKTIGENLIRFFDNETIYCGVSDFGSNFLKNSNIVDFTTSSSYLTNLENLIDSLLSINPSVFVTVGGDGISSYVAGLMAKKNKRVPIMGIAAGTANVGPIAVISPDKLENLTKDMLKLHTFGAIALWQEKKLLGYGFNDIVIGNTFLTTIEGKTVNISIEDMLLLNKKTITIPDTNIATEDFKIYKNNVLVSFSGLNPAQIVGSPLDGKQFYGKAITGALCLSAFGSPCGALALLPSPLVSMSTPKNLAKDSFFSCQHLLFTEDETIKIQGLSKTGHIAIDGNPFLNTQDSFCLTYVPCAAKALLC